MANNILDLLKSAYEELISKVYSKGSIKSTYLKPDSSGLDGVEIDFDKIIASKACEDIVAKYADDIAGLGLSAIDDANLTKEFISKISAEVKIGDDLTLEESFNTKFKTDFLNKLLDRSRVIANSNSNDPSGDTDSPDKDGGNGMKIDFNGKQVMIEIANVRNGVPDSPEALATYLAEAVMRSEIKIEDIIKLMEGKEVSLFITVNGEKVETSVAIEMLRVEVSKAVSTRSDIFRSVVAEIVKDIKYDATIDLAEEFKKIKKIFVGVEINEEEFANLVREHMSSMNVSYLVKGLNLTKVEISKLIDKNKLIEDVKKKLGIDVNGVIHVKGGDITKELAETIKEMSVEYNISMTSLLAQIKDKVGVKIVDEKGKELSEEDIKNLVTDLVREKKVEAVDTLSTTINRELKKAFPDGKIDLSSEEVLAKIADIAITANVSVSKLVKGIANRAKVTINSEQILEITNKVEIKLQNRATYLVGEEINKIIAGLQNKEYTLDSDAVFTRLANLSVSANIGVAQLVKMIANNATIKFSEEQLQALSVKLDKKIQKRATFLASEEVNSIIAGFQAKEYTIPSEAVLDRLANLSVSANIGVGRLVKEIANGANISIDSAQMQALATKLDTKLQKRATFLVSEEVNSIIAGFQAKEYTIPSEAVLDRLANLSVSANISVGRLVKEIANGANISIDSAQMQALATKLDAKLQKRANFLVSEEVNEIIAGLQGKKYTIDNEAVMERLSKLAVSANISVGDLVKRVANAADIAIDPEQIKAFETKLDTKVQKRATYLASEELNAVIAGLQGKEFKLDNEALLERLTNLAVTGKLRVKDLVKKVAASAEITIDQSQLDHFEASLNAKIQKKLTFEGAQKLKEILGNVPKDQKIPTDKLLEALGEHKKLCISLGFEDPQAIIDGIIVEVNLNPAERDVLIDGIQSKVNEGKDKAVQELLKLLGIEIDKNMDPEMIRDTIQGFVVDKVKSKFIKSVGEIDPEKIQQEIANDPALQELFLGIIGKMPRGKLREKIKEELPEEKQSVASQNVINLIIGQGTYTPGAQICVPCHNQGNIAVTGGYNYVPVMMVPGMSGGFGGGVIPTGQVPSGYQMIAPPYLPVPSYWPGFVAPQGNNEELMKLIKDLTDRIDALEKGMSGGGSGGTIDPPKPQPEETYKPTRDEVLATLTALGVLDNLVDMDKASLNGLTSQVSTALASTTGKKIDEGTVAGHIATIRMELSKTKKDQVATKQDVETAIVRLKIDIKDILKNAKDPAYVANLIAQITSLLENMVYPGKKVVGVKDALEECLKDYIKKNTKENENDGDDMADEQLDEIPLPDLSTPVEKKRGKFRKFIDWAKRHKAMLIGIPLVALGGAVGVAFAANALNATILANIASGAAAATEGILAEGGLVHGLVSRISGLGVAQWIDTHSMLAGLIGGGAVVGGTLSTVLGAVNITKGRKLASAYNGVLKSRQKVHAAEGKTRALIKAKLHLSEILFAKEQERNELKHSVKDVERLNKKISKLNKKIAKIDKELDKADDQHTDKVIKEIAKVTKLNRREKKYNKRLAGTKSLSKAGYVQKYIDLVQKLRSGQITIEEYKEKVSAIPAQFRNAKYDTFTTEIREDIAAFEENTEASVAIKKAKTQADLKAIEEEMDKEQ